jgi:Protein of unknown function (DUF3592)
MFNLFFEGAQAYNQIGLLIGAVVCLGLGGLILGNALYWRLHAYRASGTIIGVMASGGSYFPVYRTTLPDGQTHLAKSNMGSGTVRGKETGRVVPLLISAHNPNEAQQANNYVFDVVGLVLFIPGVWLAYFALTAFPVTKMTWVMGIGMLIYLAERAHRTFIPKGQRLSIEEWRKQHHLDQREIDPADVKPIESLVSAAEVQQTQQKQSQNFKKAAPFLWILAAILLAIGIYQSVKISRLQSAGLRAPGEVVRLKGEHGSNNGTTYYPIVRAHPSGNSYFEFKDSVGTNPPSYRTGDKVTVLYLADDPSRSAIIDRGAFWNWTIPVVIFLFAAVIVLILAGAQWSARPSGLQPTKAAG